MTTLGIKEDFVTAIQQTEHEKAPQKHCGALPFSDSVFSLIPHILIAGATTAMSFMIWSCR